MEKITCVTSAKAILTYYKELLTLLVGWFVRRFAQELLNRFSEMLVENQFSGPEKTKLTFYANPDKETDRGSFSHSLYLFCAYLR